MLVRERGGELLHFQVRVHFLAYRFSVCINKDSMGSIN